MIQVGELMENILKAMRRQENADDTARVRKLLNKYYFSICKMQSWDLLRTKTNIDFASSGTTGKLLPSDLFGIDRVRDTDDGFEFVRRDRAEEEPDEEGFRYYTYQNSPTATFFSADLQLGADALTFTSTLFSTETASYVGDYVKFGSEPGYYKLGTATAFTPTYRGPEIIDGDLKVRPEETLRMILLDRHENELADRDIDLHYWRAPIPLYRDSDMCILPTGLSLEKAVLIDAMGVLMRRQIAADRYRTEFKEALAEEIKMNPAFPRVSRPRDQHNSIFDLSQQYFANRTDQYNSGSSELRDILQGSD